MSQKKMNVTPHPTLGARNSLGFHDRLELAPVLLRDSGDGRGQDVDALGGPGELRVQHREVLAAVRVLVAVLVHLVRFVEELDLIAFFVAHVIIENSTSVFKNMSSFNTNCTQFLQNSFDVPIFPPSIESHAFYNGRTSISCFFLLRGRDGGTSECTHLYNINTYEDRKLG